MEDSDRWFGDLGLTRDLQYMALCLSGEAGEFANLVKKVRRGSLNIRDATTRHDMAMELADVFTYLLNLAGILGIDLEKVYEAKRKFNNERFTEEKAKRDNARRQFEQRSDADK